MEILTACKEVLRAGTIRQGTAWFHLLYTYIDRIVILFIEACLRERLSYTANFNADWRSCRNLRTAVSRSKPMAISYAW
jgi:hypothetical protein